MTMRTRTARHLHRIADRLAPPEPSIQEQILANQQQLFALADQTPQIVGAVTAAIDGGIGLGFQGPNAGGEARY